MMSEEKTIFIDLIQKYQQSSLSDEEKMLLEDLIKNDEQNAEFFKICTSSSLPMSDVEYAYSKIEDQLADNVSPKKSKVYTFKVWRYAVAASILLCGIFGIWYYTSQLPQTIVYEVPMGARSTYVLSDGSKVSLNGGSKLILDEKFGSDNRHVTIEGEGFFDVQHDSKNPFIVTSKNLKIEVLGTAFNVRDYEDDDIKQTTLLRGKVELTYSHGDSQNNYTLIPGDRVTFSKSTEATQASKQHNETEVKRERIQEEEELDKSIAWKDGILVFDNDSFPLLVSKLEKWFDVDIEIKNKSLLDKKFTGTFHEQSIQEILALLQETGGITKITNTDNTIIIE